MQIEVNIKEEFQSFDASNVTLEKEGDWMWIETRRGRIKQRAKLTDGIDPRVIAAQHGWWFPEEPAPDYGVWRSNVNVLTDNQPPYDPAMGTYQLRALLCRVGRVDELSDDGKRVVPH